MYSVFLAALMAAAPAQPSVQQAFEAAEALSAAKDWAGALTAYEALEKRISAPRTRAILQVRQGEMLIALDREEEARDRLRQGLAGLPAGDASAAVMRHEGYSALAESEERAFDPVRATADYYAAYAAASDPTDRMLALAGAVRIGMFIDPQRAVDDAATALAMVDARTDGKPEDRAAYLTLQGRALLNAGRPVEAETALRKASDLLGGLTLQVNRQDIVTRSDVAIAALRAGHMQVAREYMAYTGAGRLEEGNFTIGADMDPPACGEGADEPHPDDVVVIELAMADDGSVANVTPVFASRPGPMIARFLRAVKDWSWRPEQMEKIRPFFRSGVRLEMRCSTVVERFGATDLLQADVEDWIRAKGISPAQTGSGAAVVALSALRAELARREAADGTEAPALLPLIAALIVNPLMEDGEAAALADRGVAIAVRGGAPAEVVGWFRLKGLAAAPMKRRLHSASQLDKARAMTALAAEPAMAASARAAGAIRLTAAEFRKQGGDKTGATVLLQAVADDGRLGAHDPLKVGVLVRLSTLQADGGDLAAAQQSFMRSGLDAAQCALVDAKPALTRIGMNTSNYPDEALHWHFEGWVRAEFDITPAGRTSGTRATIAYPPFIFSASTVSGLANTRYEQSFRPGGALGCGGMTISVHYRLRA